MQTILELHRRAVDAVRPIVAGVRAGDLGLRTPCAGWDLRALIGHVIGQDHGFAAAVLGDVGVDAFAPREVVEGAHAAGASAVVEAFAVADPDREVLLPEFGGMRFPLRAVIGFHLVDTLVHGWDVAVALGGEVGYDSELIAAGLVQAEAVPDGDVRDLAGAAFARALPVGGLGGWPRVLALLGRDPGWVR